MLVESVVSFTLGLKDHRVAEVKFFGSEMRIRLDAKKNRKLCCSICGKRLYPKDKLPERKWKHVSLWGIPVVLCYQPRRVQCPDHGVRVEKMSWSMGKTPLSFPLITVLAFWTRMLPWDQVARLFNVSWGTVRAAVEVAVEYGRQREDYKGVRFIGIDEISRRKGHVYLTQVYDLDRKVLLWSGEGRSEATLQRFFDEYGEAKKAKR